MLRLRVGTLSLNINTHDLNYGAILHSWAFEKFLNGYSNIDCEVIDYTTPHFEGMNFRYPFLFYLKKGKVRRTLGMLSRLISHSKRYTAFEEFKKTQMKISSTAYTQRKLAESDLPYDVLVCESDVIWSPVFFHDDFDETFFLALPSMKDKHKVAYSPSMGNGIDKKHENRFAQLIQNFDALSCRETYAAEFTQQFTEKPISCVVDPVLLLTENQYSGIISPRIEKDPYLLIYTPVGRDNHIIKEAKKYAKAHGLKVIEITNNTYEHLRHKTYTDASVPEFLSLIKYADTVFASSFHGICFSLLFHKNFYAFSRKTGKKTEDLCGRLGLLNRYIDKNEVIEQPPLNFAEIDGKINDLRKISVAFIEDNIVNWRPAE